MSQPQWIKSVFQYQNLKNDGFCAVTAYLKHQVEQHVFPRRTSGVRKWLSSALELERQVKQQENISTPFQLQDFTSILSKYTDLRIVVFSSVNNEVLRLSEQEKAVYIGANWIKPDLELDPTVTDEEKTVWVLQDGHSYYWIKSIGGYMRSCHGDSGQKFCPLCFEWIRGRFEFHRCSAFRFRCDECGTTQFTYYDALKLHRSQSIHGTDTCDKCGRSMATGDCYERHMMWCKSRKLEFDRCAECNDSYNVNYEHECGVKYCAKCCKRYDTSVEHRCFLTRDEAFLHLNIGSEDDTEDVVDASSTEDDDLDKKIVATRPYHYAFDIECQLNPSTKDNTDSGRVDHCVCLLMVAPLHVENCDVLQFDDLGKFFEWIFKKERGKCTFWAHNAKGYDNRFLFDYLCSTLNKRPDCLWQANKLLQLRIGSRKFNDSLCHIARPLSDWPKTLGLTGNYVKGFFPHKFNTEANKEYIGTLPAKHHYEPERMKTARLEEFEKWYPEEQDKVGDRWNLQENMEKYCKSDVMLLKEGLEVYDKLMCGLSKGLSPLSSVTIASYAMKVYRNLHMPLETICELNQEEYRFVKESFKGGRTEVRWLQKTWSKEEIESGKYGVYVDIQSMYPAVQYYNDMPCGKPRWKIFDDEDQPDLSYLMSFTGSIECDIEPTKYLHHPIIGRTDSESGKFLFTLIEQKKIILTSIELQMALKHGYKVSRVYRVLEFDKTNDLFKDYVRKFLKIKIQASGFNGTDEKWKEFQRRHKEELGIELKREDMIENKGLREMAKLLLNSLWGKFGQRPDLQEEKIYTDQQFKKLMNEALDDKVVIDNYFQLPSGDVVVKTRKPNLAANLKNKNVAIAAFVAAGGRVKLWETLVKLGDRVLYHDTDSILYERDPDGYNVETGDLLGEWADELDEDKVVDFCGLGPKTYAFTTQKGKTVMKCKGFTLDSDNEKRLTLERYKELLAGYLNGNDDCVEVMCTFFGYEKFSSGPVIYSENRAKKLKVTANKSAIDRNTLKTYPFGYEQFGIEIDEVE